MTEIRRLFFQVKNRLRSGKTRDDEEPLQQKTKDEKQSDFKENENKKKMRRTPDLINSHSQVTLPPIPSDHGSRHGVIRGYPAVSGHIYEEISPNEAVIIGSDPLRPDHFRERDRQTGRGGVFYISPIDGALHRLKPESGNRIVCPHLHFDRELGPEVQRQDSFKCLLFGKNLSVCRSCAKSLRERFISGEPDVIYPTYWRSFDLGKVNIPCPNLPEDLVYESQDGDVIPMVDICRERRHSVTAELSNGRRQPVSGNTGLRREKMAAGNANDIATFEKLSCRATKCRLPEAEARLLGSRAIRGQRVNAEGRMTTHRSINNLLLSDVLRRNHDRQCLVW